ncbi:hypothetical protein [Aeromonas allosaccharophila]|uniref:hypothetical protein n=1 Tax=Aeromonas allosaccharophila TaxID=656 RepID=UPI003D222D64
MTSLITGLEVHRYAPELNKLHLRNRQTLPTPGITTIKEAKARLFGSWQPGHQVTITVSHPDYVNLSRLYRGRLTNLTGLRQHHHADDDDDHLASTVFDEHERIAAHAIH